MTPEYEVIYADPPWQYDFSETDTRKIENQYSTMTTDDICNIEIPAASNAVLYLWATAPKLLEALQVIEAWGFTYKTNAVWDKRQMGMGYWFRGQHEILLVGTKGRFSPPPTSQRKPSVFSYERGKHSKKPDEIRELIKQWFPDALRLELFSRHAVDGWHVWGNEVESDIQLVPPTEQESKEGEDG